MSTINIKTTWDGAEVEVEGLDLDMVTPQWLINEMITEGILSPESELPRKRCDGSSGYYSIIGKDGCKISTSEMPANKPMSDYGFIDGDTLRIIIVGCCA